MTLQKDAIANEGGQCHWGRGTYEQNPRRLISIASYVQLLNGMAEPLATKGPIKGGLYLLIEQLVLEILMSQQ